MDYLIQNNSSQPYIVPVKVGGVIQRITLTPDRGITKVSEEIYKECILSQVFFRAKIETGMLVVLNDVKVNQDIDKIVSANFQAHELAYERYKQLIGKIKGAGGLQNEELKRYLDAQGMPGIELLRANYGNFDPVVADQFKERYLAEAGNGIDHDSLKIPGAKLNAPVATSISNEEDSEENEDGVNENGAEELPATLEEMSFEQLKKWADERGVEYSDRITEKQLRKKIERLTSDVEE